MINGKFRGGYLAVGGGREGNANEKDFLCVDCILFKLMCAQMVHYIILLFFLVNVFFKSFLLKKREDRKCVILMHLLNVGWSQCYFISAGSSWAKIPNLVCGTEYFLLCRMFFCQPQIKDGWPCKSEHFLDGSFPRTHWMLSSLLILHQLS